MSQHLVLAPILIPLLTGAILSPFSAWRSFRGAI